MGKQAQINADKMMFHKCFQQRTFHKDCTKKENDASVLLSKKDQRKTLILTQILENVKNLTRQDQ